MKTITGFLGIGLYSLTFHVYSAGLLDTITLTNTLCGGDCEMNGIQAYSAGGAQDNLKVENMISVSTATGSGTTYSIRRNLSGFINLGNNISLAAIHRSLNEFGDNGSFPPGGFGCTKMAIGGVKYGYICTLSEASTTGSSTSPTGLGGAGGTMIGIHSFNYDALGKALIHGNGTIEYNNSTICSSAATSSAVEKANCTIKIVDTSAEQ
jgi:hypothetical protein